MPASKPENRLLSALPPDDFARLTARMSESTFGHKELIYRAAGPMHFVYFPRSGVLSNVVISDDGQMVETAAIGRDGMIGVSAAIGAEKSFEQVFCQVYPSECRKFAATEFVAEMARGESLHQVVNAYLRATLKISAQQTACNALHSVDQRCARWLLMCRDSMGVDEFNLTHEFLAVMLGVRRATVSVAASNFQTAGVIAYRHGKVKVLDRPRLEDSACGCYAIIHAASQIPAA